MKKAHYGAGYDILFPEGWPGRTFLVNAIRVRRGANHTYTVDRWGYSEWVMVGKYDTQEDADQAAENVYNMGLFSR